MKFASTVLTGAILCLLVPPSPAFAELTNVRVTSRSTVADGQSFGSSGPYEKLVGRAEFALDPADPHNKAIVDLAFAPRGADGRVHFESDFHALRPVDVARGNGVMLFEISNRGGKGLLTMFNDAPGAPDPTTPAHFGNGFLMREGYTLVWIGWEFDVSPTGLKVDAPPVTDASAPPVRPLQVRFILNQRQEEAVLSDAPMYPPADPGDPGATLTVRDRFWDAPTPIARETWRFAPAAATTAPRLEMRGGFEPGRLYEATYRAAGRRVAGVGFAAIRDAASAFRYRSDLPIAGRSAYVFGISQSGRFLRDFLRDGFNADERGRGAFDAVWPHIAGASGGSFNEVFATPTGLSAFVATRPPFLDPLGLYARGQQPKIFYTNTSVEYWGQGRAAALIHTSSGKDVKLPEDVRIYLLSGTQHGQSAFPPPKTTTQQQVNPVPQREVMRALLKGLDDWVRRGVRPPDSRYPRVDDKTLVQPADLQFPRLPGVGDPRTVTGPARAVQGKVVPFPFLVPQVDADGNEIAGIRVPDLSVPLATTTGWNFRAETVGNPGELLPLAGSYLPFSATRGDRRPGDPRPSVEERYASRDEYLQKIRAAAADLVKRRYLLEEDLERVLARATAHWDYATAKRQGSAPSASSVLFIGNSFTFGAGSAVQFYRSSTVTDLNDEGIGGVPALFKSFTTQAGLDYDVSLETRGGSGFEFHLENKLPVIGKRPWDIVVMQGQSTLDLTKHGDPAKIIATSRQLAEWLRERNPKVDLYLMATWSRADLVYRGTSPWVGKPIDEMARDVRAGIDKAAAGAPGIKAVIPVGEAWNRAMQAGVADPNPYDGIEFGKINLWTNDHYHASAYGYYLEALVVFGTLTGRDPRALGDNECSGYELGLSRPQVKALQQIAFDQLGSAVIAAPPSTPTGNPKRCAA